MAELKGTNVGAPIVPFTDQDIYATHEAKYGKGGYRSVQEVEDLDLIPEARLEEGMLVYVINDPTGIHTYQRLGGKWVRDKIGKGIPIYNQDLINDLDIDVSTETYISIPDKDTDLDSGDISTNTYTTTINGNYVDVLFRAVRELQSEVSRLKNSFRYGIESYTGTKTAMSETLGEIEDPEEEPLWAVDEDGLSEEYEFPYEKPETLVTEDLTSSVTSITDPVTYSSYLEVEGKAAWTAPESLASIEDPKMFLYLTTKGTDIQLEVSGYEETTVTTPDTYGILDIDLNDFPISNVPSTGYYNTLVILGRKQILNSKPLGNSNFIWISISNPETNQALQEGYLKDGKLVNIGDSGITSINDVSVSKRYQFNKIWFNDTTITKFKVYSKYQDFSNEVIGSIPSDETYKFKVAHLTIRSVDTVNTLTAMKDQILNNELIWEEGTSRLWIKTNNKLAVIGGSSSSSDNNNGSDMTQEELISALKEMGIVYEEGGNLEVNNLNVEDITFIHTATGRKYKFSIDADGNICNSEVPEDSALLANRITKAGYTLAKDVRGFIGTLNIKEAGGSRTTDARLNSDRLKIGAFYAPFSSDIAHGCTHSFVELENTSDKDIALEGCYLHYTRPNAKGTQVLYSLPLTGIIKAGSTYLVRGAKHTDASDPNAYIKVNTCDQEWYSGGSLVSFEIDESITLSTYDNGYGFCLTYGNSFGDTGETLKYNTVLVTASSSADDKTVGSTGDTFSIGSSTSVYPYILQPGFIDGIYYYKSVTNQSGSGYWATACVTMTENSMYRNTFELDPAKQAFQAFTTKDSSRCRWANTNNDFQVVSLGNEYITFPNTDDVYAVSNYTPKASWEGKNVSTDKTKLDTDRPNMVTCSFGIDIYKTRTFNWISVGYFNEYIWLKKTSDTKWTRFSSYIPIHQIIVDSVETETTGGSTSTKITFRVEDTDWTSGASLSAFTAISNSSHTLISNSITSFSVASNSYTAFISGDVSGSVKEGDTCYLQKSSDDTLGSTYPKKKFFNGDVTNNVYSRIVGTFPADGSRFTSHKVIVDVVDTNVSTPTEYTYVVGRADKSGNPDPLHTSEEMTFTLYPDTYKTRIYQTTDQQGFHWIEYQVWAATADQINTKIEADTKANTIIPILVNTGDMTQNGTRINEWFDYYQAGRNLFNHLEQVNVVGNNDLCGTNPEELGTGDDSGKSNSFYFHLFYCYEVGDAFTPLVKNVVGDSIKYVPSLYYLDSKTDRFLAVNSEITETNCKDWYGLVSSTNSRTINIYTGFDIDTTTSSPNFHSELTTIYNMVYNALNTAGGKSVIAMCHEMPFTVTTNDSLLNNYKGVSRSLSNSDALVGSHLNQISPSEKYVTDSSTKMPTNKPGIYWFSRLLEYFGVKLCIGGHKHTYACTYPVRENYTYTTTSGEIKSSKDGPMTMSSTLENDTVNFLVLNNENAITQDTSKFPLVKRSTLAARTDEGFYPYEPVENLTGGVTYFMCQASGYKLTSNKELPSAQQAYSMIIPETSTTYSGGSYTDKAANNQKYPMFAIIDVNNGTYSVRLARVENIFNGNYRFTQTLYGTSTPVLKYLTQTSSNNYGSWSNTKETELFSI